jgi:hypothetical protein
MKSRIQTEATVDLYLVTRKTTTMMFKMFSNERKWEHFGRMKKLPKYRQMFVTQSRVLATKVQEYFSRVMASLVTSDKSWEELAALAREKKRRREAEELIHADDDLDWNANLPAKFSELRDGHFPLFITFDDVSQAIQTQNGIFIDVTLVVQPPPSRLSAIKLPCPTLVKQDIRERHWKIS